MPPIVQDTGITFAVDKVVPATKPLPECRAHVAARKLLQAEIESCSDYHGTVISGIGYQALLAAVFTAFSQHRPLVLTADAVWITISQGVAHHMALHGERLRSRFVQHQGRLKLEFFVTDWVEGSPENPWPKAFASWAEQIREHVGPAVHDALVCDFSTTGPVERVASHVVMMDVFERYFEYVLYCICGIPNVTLEGRPEDWQRLAEKVKSLEVFDLSWWLDHLTPICEQFVRASQGDVDLTHWQGICKLREEYGGHVINGWVAKLFPYLRAHADGPCTRRNPIFETGEGFQTAVAPPGLSRVPFLWRNLKTGGERSMEAIGGLLGVTQNPETLALRPKVGWAVRPAEKLDALLDRLTAEHKTRPGVRFENEREDIPLGLARFYHHTDGAILFENSAALECCIVSLSDYQRLDWQVVDLPPDQRRARSDPRGPFWYRLAQLPDGCWLAINPRPGSSEALREGLARSPKLQSDSLCAICLFSPITQGEPGQNPVIALSFTELLQRLLDSRDRPYWNESQFIPYGDAEDYGGSLQNRPGA